VEDGVWRFSKWRAKVGNGGKNGIKLEEMASRRRMEVEV